MAFADLFTKICDVDEAVKNPSNFNPSHRNKIIKGPSRKRTFITEEAGLHVKRQRFQEKSAGAMNTVHKNDPDVTEAHRTFNRTSKYERSCFASEVMNNNKDKAVSNHQSETGNTKNGKKKKKKNKGKKKAQRYVNYNESRRGKNEGIKQSTKRFMTQEFKEQNALEVDGRFLCKHFLRGRCIKGDECQLEHIEGYNDLIKEVCKFYVQGCCLKGKTCPYMHQSFPCMFFHKKGKCRRENCKYSHDPLNDFTEKLLDDAIKRDNDLLELNKKAEQGSLSQPDDVSEAVEDNASADIGIQPIRNFYGSSDTNIEEEVLQSDNQQPDNIITEEDVLLPTEDSSQLDNSAPSDLNTSGPVCYSVEAVLGHQLYKPFLYTAPGIQDTPHSVAETAIDNTSNPINAPYAVNNVLKSKTDSTGRPLCGPPIDQTVAAEREVKDKGTSIRLNDKYNVSQLAHHEQLQKDLFKHPPSFHVSAAPGYCKKQSENKTLKPAQSGSESNKTKEDHKEKMRESLPNQMPMDKPHTADLKTKNVPSLKNMSSAHNCQRPKQKVKEKSNQSSSVLKDNTATKDSTPDHQILQETNTGTSLNNSPKNFVKIVTGHRQESVLSSNLADSSNKTTSKQFQSLFSSLVPDAGQPLSVSNGFTDKPAVLSAQSFKKSHCDSQKVDCSPKQAPKTHFAENTTNSSNAEEVTVDSNSRNIKDTTGCDKTPVKSFLSLFAAPPCESTTTTRSSLQEPGPSYEPSEVKRSNKISSQTSIPEKMATKPRYRTEENTNEHGELTSRSSSSSNKSTSPTRHQSHNGPPSSVLRTLFQHLRPYEQQEEHQDQGQIGVYSGGKTGKSNGCCASAVEPTNQKSKATAASPFPHKIISDVPLFYAATSLQTRSPRGPDTMSQKPPSEVKTGNTGAVLKDLFKTLHPLKL